LKKFESTRTVVPEWNIRVGIHSGHLIAGVVGSKKLAFDVWGDTVNVAHSMERAGVPGKVNISKRTYELVKDFFICESRGLIRAKNKGEMEMFLVRSIKPELLSFDNPNEKFWSKYQELVDLLPE